MSWRHFPRDEYRILTIYRRRSIFALAVVLSAGRCYHILAGRKTPLFSYGHRVGALRICVLPAEGRRVFCADAGTSSCANGSLYRERRRAFVRTSDRRLAYSRLVGGRAPLFFADAGTSSCANDSLYRERRRAFVRTIRSARRTHAAALLFAGERQPAALAAANRRVAVPRHLRLPEARGKRRSYDRKREDVLGTALQPHRPPSYGGQTAREAARGQI